MCVSLYGRWVDWLNQAWLQCYDKSQRQLQMTTQLDQETLFQKARSLEGQVVSLRKEVASKDHQLQVGKLCYCGRVAIPPTMLHQLHGSWSSLQKSSEGSFARAGTGWQGMRQPSLAPTLTRQAKETLHRVTLGKAQDRIAALETQVVRTQGVERVRYTVLVYTAQQKSAATSARVWLELVGETGVASGRKQLRAPAGCRAFARGAVDKFDVASVDVGTLIAVRVGHDNGGCATLNLTPTPTHTRWLGLR